jgi:hypothetical protein
MCLRHLFFWILSYFPSFSPPISASFSFMYTHKIHRYILPNYFDQLIFVADFHLKFGLSDTSRWRLVVNEDIQVEAVPEGEGACDCCPALYSAGKSKLHMLIWQSEIEVHVIRFAQSCPWTSLPYFFSFTFESKCSMQQCIQNVDSARVIDSIHMNGSNWRAENVARPTNHYITRRARPEFQDPLIGLRSPVISAPSSHSGCPWFTLRPGYCWSDKGFCSFPQSLQDMAG